MKWLPNAVLYLLACVFFSGCLVQRAEPPRSSFSFAPELPGLPPRSGGPVVAVRMFEAAPEFENQWFVYRVSEFNWESDFFRVFAGSPQSQLTILTRRGLAGSGLFSSVAIPGLAQGNSWQLQGFIPELYGDFRDRSAPIAVISMKFTLLAPGATAARPAVFTRRYEAKIPLEKSSPDGLMRAWDRGFEKILSELIGDLRKVDWKKDQPTGAPRKMENPS